MLLHIFYSSEFLWCRTEYRSFIRRGWNGFGLQHLHYSVRQAFSMTLQP